MSIKTKENGIFPTDLFEWFSNRFTTSGNHSFFGNFSLSLHDELFVPKCQSQGSIYEIFIENGLVLLNCRLSLQLEKSVDGSTSSQNKSSKKQNDIIKTNYSIVYFIDNKSFTATYCSWSDIWKGSWVIHLGNGHFAAFWQIFRVD